MAWALWYLRPKCYLMASLRLEGEQMAEASSGLKTVLVIEDDPWTRTITTALLAGEGFGVVEAKNGEEGLTQARTHAPDAILLDLALPTKSGLEVLRELKSEPITQDIPVIVV